MSIVTSRSLQPRTASMGSAWLYTLIPAGAAILGAAVAVVSRPGPTLISAIQHFAAGVVFAAAAGEILPDLKHGGSAWAVVIGGAAGVALMLLVKQLEEWVKGPVGLLTTVGIDILIDGLVLGIGFAAGKIVLSMLAAYAIVYFRFKLGTLFFWMIFTTLLLPLEVRIVPSYEVMTKLSLTNTYTGLIVPLLASAMDGVVSPATAIALGVGAGQVASGSLSAGTLVAFVLYLTMLFGPVQQLSQVFDGYQQAAVGLRRIGDLLRTPSSLRTRRSADTIAFSHSMSPSACANAVASTSPACG